MVRIVLQGKLPINCLSMKLSKLPPLPEIKPVVQACSVHMAESCRFLRAAMRSIVAVLSPLTALLLLPSSDGHVHCRCRAALHCKVTPA